MGGGKECVSHRALVPEMRGPRPPYSLYSAVKCHGLLIKSFFCSDLPDEWKWTGRDTPELTDRITDTQTAPITTFAHVADDHGDLVFSNAH